MYFFLGLFLLVLPAHSARILAMFPTPSVSHQVVYRALMMELARRGHEVVIITTDAVSEKEVPANYTQIDVHDLSYKHFREVATKLVDGTTDTWKFIEACTKAINDVCEFQLVSPEVQHLLHSGQHFDLVFVESFAEPAFVLSHIFRAPMILFNSFGFVFDNAEVFGAPSHRLFYPDPTRKRLYNLSFFEKIQALYYEFRSRRISWKQKVINEEKVKRLFGPNTPSISEMLENVDMMFLNVYSMWDDNRPLPPSVIYTGGLHLKPTKELPADLQAYLDSSKRGVIYMSFGTNVDTKYLSEDRIKIFCNVFSKLPYDILWKWNEDELPGKPQNVKLSKWLPQADLLRHPKVKLFITQAGLQSSDEAIAAGVPIVAFPMLGDQWYNSEKYEHFEIGKQLDFMTVTEDILEGTINTVIGEKMYKDNIERLGSLMRDQPQQAMERAVWWTEHVLRRRGARHLRSRQANVSWAEYLVLDILLSFVALTSVLSLVLYKIVKVVFYGMLQSSRFKNEKQKFL